MIRFTACALHLGWHNAHGALLLLLLHLLHIRLAGKQGGLVLADMLG